MSNNRTPRGLSPIEPAELRDAASPAAVERVWQRLEESIDTRPARARRGRGWSWGVAASLLAFGGGLWTGRQSSEPVAFTAQPLSAEPLQAGAPLLVDPVWEWREDAAHTPERARSHEPRSPRAVRRGRSNPVSPEVELAEPEHLEGVPEPEGVVRPPESPQWQRLANGGEYEAAWFELAQLGGFENVLSRSTPEQLMLLADVARATGQRQRAIAALRRVVSDFGDDPVAPLAAWSLGTLLERAGDERGAARAFAAYRALSPEGDFAEDALVRQIESAVQRRERELAHELLAQYERDFPQGGRRSEVVRKVARLDAAGAGVSWSDGGLEGESASPDEAEVDEPSSSD